jgi:hypothetical protein
MTELGQQRLNIKVTVPMDKGSFYDLNDAVLCTGKGQSTRCTISFRDLSSPNFLGENCPSILKWEVNPAMEESINDWLTERCIEIVDLNERTDANIEKKRLSFLDMLAARDLMPRSPLQEPRISKFTIIEDLTVCINSRFLNFCRRFAKSQLSGS